MVVRAQQPVMPVIGFLSLVPLPSDMSAMVAFRQGLAEAGFIDGRTVAIEYRWANNQRGRLARFAAGLVQRQVAVIVAIDTN